MQTIKCPNCGKEFTLEEKDYSDILKQVRNHEFTTEINEKLDQVKEKLDNGESAEEILKDMQENMSITKNTKE